jgi:hypothetical protein
MSPTDVNDRISDAGVNKGERAAFPQARVVGLAECGTPRDRRCRRRRLHDGENTLAETWSPVSSRMLVLADRGFCGFLVAAPRRLAVGPVVAGES